MVGVTSKLQAAQKIRDERPGKEPDVDQKARMMDIWATHPGNKTLHREGGKVMSYQQGGFVDWTDTGKKARLGEGAESRDSAPQGFKTVGWGDTTSGKRPRLKRGTASIK